MSAVAAWLFLVLSLGSKFDVPDVSTLAPIPDNEMARAAVNAVTAESKATRRGMVDALGL